MTDRIPVTMSNERLDRLIAQVLTDRAEDVAAASIAADGMAARVSATVRPAYLQPLTMRAMGMAVLLLALVGLLLAAIVAASLIGSPPAELAPSTFECGRWAPGSDPGTDAVTVVDATGAATGCRGVADQPAGIGEFSNGDVDIVIRPGGRWVVIAWLAAGCDGPARLDISGQAPTHLEIAVTQTRTPPCGPGMGVRTIELEFPMVIRRDAVSGSVTYPSDGP